MAQFLRPISNITQSSFTGGFAEIDETTAVDTDFAYGANNTAATLEVGITAADNPGTGTTTIRYRLAQTNNGVLDGTGNTLQITASLYQGTTLISSDTARTTSGTWTTYSWAPSTASVTNWADLRLRFVTTASGGGASVRRGGAISWAEVEAPDPLRALVTTSTVTAAQSATILVEKNLAANTNVTTTASATAEGEKFVTATINTSVTVTNASLTITANLISSLSSTADASGNLEQSIALAASVLGTNIIAALGIADNPVSATVVVNVTTNTPTLTNIFNAAASISSTATLSPATLSIIMPLASSVIASASQNSTLVLSNLMGAGASATIIGSGTVALSKLLNAQVSTTAEQSSYLLQTILVSSSINTSASSYAKLLNASEAYISGVVLDGEGHPIQRTLYLYRRSDGVKIGETVSNLATGEYQFITPPTAIEYFVVLIETNSIGSGEDKIKGRVIPYILEE